MMSDLLAQKALQIFTIEAVHMFKLQIHGHNHARTHTRQNFKHASQKQ